MATQVKSSVSLYSFTVHIKNYYISTDCLDKELFFLSHRLSPDNWLIYSFISFYVHHPYLQNQRLFLSNSTELHTVHNEKDSNKTQSILWQICFLLFYSFYLLYVILHREISGIFHIIGYFLENLMNYVASLHIWSYHPYCK